MKRSSRPPRTSGNLCESVQQRLNMYALAASTAGVSMLALVRPSEAKIIYTPAHHVIGVNHVYQLDVNHDGVNDFEFVNSTSCHSVCSANLLVRYSGRNVNRVRANSRALALRAGARIGTHEHFLSMAKMGSCQTFTSCLGPWANGGKGVKNRYLGLKFGAGKNIHYGWARFNVTFDGTSFTETLTGYAYETTPNKAILAGQTKETDGEDAVEQLDSAFLNAPT